MNRKQFLPLLVAAGALAGMAGIGISKSKDSGKIRVMIIDGQNNHNWVDTTPFLKGQLEATGRFEVSVATTPPKGAKAEDWAKFKPDFSSCDVVLSNYNGPKWEPSVVRDSFEKFLNDGGGLVNIHAANNANGGWENFEKATGLLWRGSSHGARVYLDKAGKVMRMEAGEGPGAGHGPQHEYVVESRAADHPIMKDVPTEWLHAKDELYHGQRGPGENMNILATAFSAKDKKGTEVNEPLLWWIPVGKGKAVTNVLGHVGRSDKTGMPAMKCVGFLTLVARSCEWAATGEVTIPIPENFPTADKVSLLK